MLASHGMQSVAKEVAHVEVCTHVSVAPVAAVILPIGDLVNVPAGHVRHRLHTRSVVSVAASASKYPSESEHGGDATEHTRFA